MVFFLAWICVPIDVVLCNNSLLWELLPEGSKGAIWPGCLRNSCFDMHICRGCCCTGYFAVILAGTILAMQYLHMHLERQRSCIHFRQPSSGNKEAGEVCLRHL